MLPFIIHYFLQNSHFHLFSNLTILLSQVLGTVYNDRGILPSYLPSFRYLERYPSLTLYSPYTTEWNWMKCFLIVYIILLILIFLVNIIWFQKKHAFWLDKKIVPYLIDQILQCDYDHQPFLMIYLFNFNTKIKLYSTLIPVVHTWI